MIRHYLVSAVANIMRRPFTTVANILTLALGLACFVAAWGVANYWQSGDTYHATADRTLVVGQTISRVDQAEPNPLRARSAAALAKYLAQDVPGIERIARVYTRDNVAIAAGKAKALLSGAFADPEFMRIFDLEFIVGDARQALDRPGSVVLTREAAERLFGDEPALGRTVLVGGDEEATVTGVIRLIRQPSFMGTGPEAAVRFDMLGHWTLDSGGINRDSAEMWVGTQGWTFMTLKPGFSAAAFNEQMPAFVQRRMPADQQKSLRMELEAFPVSEMAARELDNALLAGVSLNLTVVAILIGLAGLTLLVAAINYANLATAQSTSRMKEMGMRKTVGATRALVILQSLFETLLQSLLALGVALLILVMAAPLLRNVAGVDVLYVFANGPEAALLLGGLVAAVSLLAGAYPALVLSGARPISALRSGRLRGGSKFVARVLVAIQFATATFLLIMLTVTQLQQASLRRTVLAAQQDPVVMLADILERGVTYEALEGALAREPAIKSMTVVDREPWTTDASILMMTRTPEEGAVVVQTLLRHVGHDYFRTLGLGTVAGRVFDRQRESIPRAIVGADPSQPIPAVVDEQLAAALGFATPSAAVDQVVYLPVSLMRIIGGRAPQPVHIVGVVEADRSRVGAIAAAGNIYFFAPNSPFRNPLYPVIRIDRANVPEALAAIDRAWEGLSPNTPAGVQFLDDLFYRSYRQHDQISQLFILLAATAFVIASIGLLGVAVHVASRRRHEIAVRKTLGSSVAGVIRLLLTDFSIPVLIGNLLAWPLGYLAAQAYLAAFAYRIELGPAPFLLSLLITLAIAWAAVIGVVLKAASVRPAEVLRHA